MGSCFEAGGFKDQESFIKELPDEFEMSLARRLLMYVKHGIVSHNVSEDSRRTIVIKLMKRGRNIVDGVER